MRCLLLLPIFVSLAPSHAAGYNIRQRQIRQDDNRPAVGPVKVGDKLSTRIDQSEASAVLPEFAEDGSTLSYTNSFRASAPYTTVHFSTLDLGSSCKMIVTGKDLPDGRAQVYEMVGKGKMQLGTFWTQHVKGDTMYIQIQCPSGVQAKDEAQFAIDEVAVGFLEEDEEESSKSDAGVVCGRRDFQNVVCYSGTEQYTRARAVARQLINGNGFCTGWLISSNNHFVTNNHCLNSQSDANNIDFEFGAEAPNCTSSNCVNCHAGTIFSGSIFLRSSKGLDYTVVRLTQDAASTYGHLEVDNREATVGEQIYIPQHPARRAKEFGFASTHPSDNGFCRVDSVDSLCGNEVRYYCDTEGGSSGSPVLAASSNKVIALHYASVLGGCDNGPNRAIAINKVWAEIGVLVTACGGGGEGFSFAKVVKGWGETLFSWMPGTRN